MIENREQQSFAAVHTHTHTQGIVRKQKTPAKKESAITLVALVVTIVVLLILAGITLTYVLGDNSVFNQASQAKIRTELAKIEERAQTIYSEKLIHIASSTLSTKVETSQIIEQLKSEGYAIEKRTVSEGDITGISLDKESLTMGYNKTVELQVTYEGAEDPFIYYVEVQGKYYEMHSSKGFITIDREASTLTKADFETEGGEGITTALKITSSNETVATAKLKDDSNNTIVIESKEVEGEKETTITVTYGSLKPQTCKVKVGKPILATDITLNETEYVVTGGESWTNDKQLIATLKPANVTEKEVNWKSSNPEIATVDNTGLVKAGTKGGEVTITATTKDGTNLSAECKITTELFGKTNSSSVSYTDSDGNRAKIPDGYAVGTSDNVNKVTGGLVAQDDEGNQFVWIPVGNVKKNNSTAFTVELGRYASFSASATPVASVDTQIGKFYKELTDSNGSSYGNTKAKNLQKFIDNTKNDSGYWFARFEASKSSRAKSKYDKTDWVDITQPEAATAARNMKSSGSYQSDLVNSYAWDTAIIFIEKSGHTGYASQKPKNSSKLNTGKSGDKVCNIYDMASNCREWSTETYASANPIFPCSARGGFCKNSDYYTSYRSCYSAGSSSSDLSFRCTLFRP